jgi:hypothetical protein
MRARAEAEDLAIGRRGRGRVAVREREGSDGWGYLVSGCERESERGRAQRGCGPSWNGPACGPVSGSSTVQCYFLFLLCNL